MLLGVFHKLCGCVVLGYLHVCQGVSGSSAHFIN